MHLRGDIQVEIGQASDPGPKEQNEDALGVRIPAGDLLATKGIAAVIADGVSAASAAKEASEAAVINFLNDYYETPEPWEVKTAGHRVLSALNRWLFSQGLGHSSQEKGCVTTFTGLILKSQTGHLFHIGDSRLYRLREGEFKQLSTDHSSQVSAETSYLVRALGLVHSPRIDYQNFAVRVDDIYLLTTDGVHDTLPPADLQKHLESHAPLEAADALDKATAQSDDNRSCLVVKILSLPDTDQNEVFRRLTELPFPPDFTPGMSIDGLRIQRVLSATRNTQLYLVKEEATEREMVMKTPSITFSDSPAYLERFALEEWIGLRTKHLNLAKVVKPHQTRTACYYLLEYIPGLTLTKWLEKNTHPQLDDIVAIISQIIDGVRALHRSDTIHQDLKPDNILVLPGNIVKIIDYGSCHIGGISEMASPFPQQSALGTIDFSAPEYRYGARPSTKSDLFSIAAITYFLIAKQKHPYGPTWEKAQTLHDFMNLKYLSATRHNPMVPLWFDAALQKALAPTPSGRYETMSEFLHDLRTPNYTLLSKDSLPFIEQKPLLFWKILSAALFVLLILSLLFR